MKSPRFFLLLVLAGTLSHGALSAQEEGQAAPSIQGSEGSDAGTTADEASAGSGEVVEQKGDVLEMRPAPAGPTDPIRLPRRGMDMSAVEREFGPPASREPAVGSPPITRWNYAGFSVFFEHRHVVHSVQQDRPAEIYRKEELLPATAP